MDGRGAGSPYHAAVLVWMDLEMTGLDPSRHVIVEVATLITDDDLAVVAEGPDLVVHQPPEAIAAMDDFVREMHTRSGLLPAIEASKVSLDDAGAQTLAFIKEHVPEPRTVPLCGNSIGTDRRFLSIYLNDIEEYLHYRSVDVSTIKELARRWYPDVLAGQARKATSHRALDDIRESIDELRFYRERLFVPVPVADGPPADPDAACPAARAGGARRPRRHLRPTAGGHQTALPSHRAAERQQHRRPGEHREEQRQRHGEQRRGEPTERADAAQHPPQLHGGDRIHPDRRARARRPTAPPTERSSHHVACTCRVNHAATSRASAGRTARAPAAMFFVQPSTSVARPAGYMRNVASDRPANTCTGRPARRHTVARPRSSSTSPATDRCPSSAT